MGIPSAVKGPIMSQSLTFITSATLNKCSNRVHGCGVSICAPRAERRRYREMEIAQRYPGRAWCPRLRGLGWFRVDRKGGSSCAVGHPQLRLHWLHCSFLCLEPRMRRQVVTSCSASRTRLTP